MKIFGREPVVFVGVLEGALALLMSLNKFGLTHETIALIMAAVMAALGLYTAFVTKDTLLGVGMGLAKAIVALAIGYGFEPPADTTAAAIALVGVVAAAFQRTQTAPVLRPNFNPNPSAEINRLAA